jgi:hypothetical protein
MRKNAQQAALTLGDMVMLVVGVVMLIAPFVVSLVTNFGRRGVRGQGWRQRKQVRTVGRSATA